jgi:hypothetical protein
MTAFDPPLRGIHVEVARDTSTPCLVWSITPDQGVLISLPDGRVELVTRTEVLLDWRWDPKRGWYDLSDEEDDGDPALD